MGRLCRPTDRARRPLHRIFTPPVGFLTISVHGASQHDSVIEHRTGGLLVHLHSRVRASWGWARLDREIVDGLATGSCEARRLRARQLMLPEERRGIAAVLQNILDAACTARSTHRRANQHGGAAIRASRDRLLDLIAMLRSDAPMSIQAVALAELLACDRSSPLRAPDRGVGLTHALDQIGVANRTRRSPGATGPRVHRSRRSAGWSPSAAHQTASLIDCSAAGL
jgi:hypothetical protein